MPFKLIIKLLIAIHWEQVRSNYKVSTTFLLRPEDIGIIKEAQDWLTRNAP